MTASSAVRDAQVALTGQRGLLTAMVTDILQRGLEVELTAHVGHVFRDAGPSLVDNCRNGAYAKHLTTDLGVVELQMPRDRKGTFDPVTVPKHGRRRLTSTADLVRLYASGTTRAEMLSQLNRMNRFELTPETADAIVMNLEHVVRVWQRRRFERSYPVILLDTITAGTRAEHRFLDVAVAVDDYGEPELLGIWRRRYRVRGADRWSLIFAELQFRGLADPRTIFASDDPELADAANAAWPHADVQSGVEDLIANSLR